MDSIGGYFELELGKGSHYHNGAIRLNTARNCFEYILLSRCYRKVYIPYYTCEVMLEPLRKYHIEYTYYSINEQLEPDICDLPVLKNNEAFLYTNYYGLKQKMAEILAKMYGKHLIVDNSQAFYAPRITGIDTFYSARKFFGVADGAYLWTDMIIDDSFEQDESWSRMLHLLKRIDDGANAGYSDFRRSDESLNNQPIKRMSRLTEKILSNIDYSHSGLQRRANYMYLHATLSKSNLLDIPLSDSAVPMVYPYWNTDISLRHRLIENKIFVATYWANVQKWCNKEQLENRLANEIIPLPIDQRYTIREMDRILKIIIK